MCTLIQVHEPQLDDHPVIVVIGGKSVYIIVSR